MGDARQEAREDGRQDPPPQGEAADGRRGLKARALADLNPLAGFAGAPPGGEHLAA
jgi:hypothetical protein